MKWLFGLYTFKQQSCAFYHRIITIWQWWYLLPAFLYPVPHHLYILIRNWLILQQFKTRLFHTILQLTRDLSSFRWVNKMWLHFPHICNFGLWSEIYRSLSELIIRAPLCRRPVVTTPSVRPSSIRLTSLVQSIFSLTSNQSGCTSPSECL